MSVATYNRGADRIMECALGGTALDLRMLIVTGTQTGVLNQDLSTVADLDAVASVAIHSERIALTGESSTQDDGNNRANVDSNDVAFAAAPGVTAQAAVIYDEGGGTDATRHLVAGSTTGYPQPMDGGLNVTVTDFLRVLTATA